jgi:hypothetical protein
MTVELDWRTQVSVRETAVEKLIVRCGDLALRRRLGMTDARTREYRIADDGIERILRMEAVLDSETFVRPIGEGRAP